MTKKQKKTIKEEFEKMIDRHLYTMADYSISSKKIDNEILATTGEKIKEDIWQFLRQTLQRFIEETIGEMYRNVVLSDKYPNLAKENKVKFKTKREIEEKMKQWLKENL